MILLWQLRLSLALLQELKFPLLFNLSNSFFDFDLLIIDLLSSLVRIEHDFLSFAFFKWAW